ncbi:hypothetical protein EBR56_04755 [bacterium]|nr:hypothetical protein [bacterium]
MATGRLHEHEVFESPAKLLPARLRRMPFRECAGHADVAEIELRRLADDLPLLPFELQEPQLLAALPSG